MKKILSICGSPRKGNSETLILKLKEILEEKGIENEVILLRNVNIDKCDGCVEFCNHNLFCKKNDDLKIVLEKMEEADGYVFVSPNYFKMPPGIFKNFIDRSSVLFTAGADLSKKKAIVIAVGTDQVEDINECLDNIAKNYCETMGMKVSAKKSFRTRSELKGNYNDVFENGMNTDVLKDLEIMADSLLKDINGE